ncbi:MAG: hypothetical protein ACHP7O_02060 [Burkholderiales bacterium]
MLPASNAAVVTPGITNRDLTKDLHVKEMITTCVFKSNTKEMVMQKNDNEFFFDKCVYAIVETKIIKAAELDEDGTGRLFDKTRWTAEDAAFTEAIENGRVLTLLLNDTTDSLNVKWIAIVESIELAEEGTAVTFSFIEEFDIPVSVSMMPIFGSGCALGDGLTGTHAICKTPAFINVYLDWTLSTESDAEELKHDGNSF